MQTVRKQLTGLVAYSLHISKGPMTKPWPAAGNAVARVFFVLVIEGLVTCTWRNGHTFLSGCFAQTSRSMVSLLGTRIEAEFLLWETSVFALKDKAHPHYER